MPRPPRLPNRSAIPEDELADYDAALARARNMRADQPGASVPPYFAAVLNSPPIAAGLGNMGRLVRTAGEREGSYSHRDRELVDQVLSALWETNVVQSTHLPDALAVGISLETIGAIRAGRDDDLSDGDQALAAYVRAVATGTVDDASYAAIVDRFGPRGAVEFTVFIGFLMATVRLHQALGMDDPSEQDITDLIASFRDGSRTVPDFRTRIR